VPFIKVEFKPGIRREGTQYAEQGSWYDCDKVRFRAGRPEKMGGWVSASDEFLKGVTRVMFNWTTLDSQDLIALGTHKKFYVETSGQYYDITPVRLTDTNNNPITSGAAGELVHTYTTSAPHGALPGDFVTISDAVNVDGICTDVYSDPFQTTVPASTLVNVNTASPHFASVGDVVSFSGATTVDGIPDTELNDTFTIVEVLSPTSYTIQTTTGATAGFTTGGGTVTAVYLGRLNREFEIINTPSATSFTFRTDTPCSTGGVTGGGTDVVAEFQVSIGFSINIVGGGWSTGYWGRQAWGSPRTSSVSGISMRIWSVDNYGEDLLFCTRDGPLYLWDASSGLGVRGVPVASILGASDVPGQVSIVRVTDDRHVLAIGSTSLVTSVFDPLLIRWSNQEDFLDWTPSITNTAGSQRIPIGSYVVAAVTSRQETLIWTDRSLHSLQFTGPPYTFSLQTLAENVNIAGPNAAVNVNNVTYWMGINKFWVYSGRAEAIECPVQRFVFDTINKGQLAQIYAATNEKFSEVTWFYCDNTSERINRYVTYNYEQNVWYYGTLDRTAMVQCPGRGGFPYAAAGGYTEDDGRTFIHEIGYDDGSTNPPSPISAFIESADFSLLNGERIVFADRLIPDLTFTRSTANAPSAELTVQAKKFPGQPIQVQDARIVSKTITATVDQFTQQVWVRLRGREMRIKVSSDGLGVSWLLGSPRLNVRPDGVQ
jgi:hypothetical protein